MTINERNTLSTDCVNASSVSVTNISEGQDTHRLKIVGLSRSGFLVNLSYGCFSLDFISTLKSAISQTIYHYIFFLIYEFYKRVHNADKQLVYDSASIKPSTVCVE